MSKTLHQLEQSVTNLRADLTATNTALDCLLSVLTVEQQKQCLSAMAQLFVAQEEVAQTSDMQEAALLLRDAADLRYQAMLVLHQARMQKAKPQLQ
jgi:hypothetical protein